VRVERSHGVDEGAEFLVASASLLPG